MVRIVFYQIGIQHITHTAQGWQNKMNTREQDLMAALLWLRNHYDVGVGREMTSSAFNRELKIKVLERIDKVLADGPDVKGHMMVDFRNKYMQGETKV